MVPVVTIVVVTILVVITLAVLVAMLLMMMLADPRWAHKNQNGQVQIPFVYIAQHCQFLNDWNEREKMPWRVKPESQNQKLKKVYSLEYFNKTSDGINKEKAHVRSRKTKDLFPNHHFQAHQSCHTKTAADAWVQMESVARQRNINKNNQSARYDNSNATTKTTTINKTMNKFPIHTIHNKRIPTTDACPQINTQLHSPGINANDYGGASCGDASCRLHYHRHPCCACAYGDASCDDVSCGHDDSWLEEDKIHCQCR